MKRRYLLMVCMLLAILTLGAASASEDIVSEDDLAVENVADDSIAEVEDSVQADEDPVLADSEEESVGYDEEDFECDIHPYGCVNYDNELVDFYVYDKSLQGTLTISVNNSLNRTFNVEYDDVYVSFNDMGMTSPGIYLVDVYFNNELVKSGTSHLYAYDFYAYGDLWERGSELRVEVYLPSDVKGKVTATVNGATYTIYGANGQYTGVIDTNGWKVDAYKIIVKYSGDEKYPEDFFETSVMISPVILLPEFITVGENEVIMVNCPGATGSGKLTVEDLNSGATVIDKNVTIIDGRNFISLPNLDEGPYEISFVCKINNETYNKLTSITVEKNNPEFTSSIAKTEITEGDSFVINIDIPAYGSLYITVDGYDLKFIDLPNSQKVELISGLPVGTHHIKIKGEYNIYYSNSFLVTVKAKPAPAPVKDVVKLTLSKVKVKKSAKKLVIKATLKINGKAKKGLKVKFKFNKKSYAAKTDAKGVAKITVKKTVLKKLKVGKKITYQASYGKTVKKIAVKVKK